MTQKGLYGLPCLVIQTHGHTGPKLGPMGPRFAPFFLSSVFNPPSPMALPNVGSS